MITKIFLCIAIEYTSASQLTIIHTHFISELLLLLISD